MRLYGRTKEAKALEIVADEVWNWKTREIQIFYRLRVESLW